MLGNGVIRGTAYDLRAETFDYFWPDRSWEIAGWARLARRYGKHIVEWMCNTGELACGLARRNFEAIGVDLVPEMLLVAERRASALPPERRPHWIQDDIRDAALARRDKDVAIIAGNAFGQLLTRSDQLDALSTVWRHLRPGGALALTARRALRESVPTKTGIYGPSRPTPTELSLRKVVRQQYDAETQLLTMHERVEIRREDHKRHFEYAYSVRLFHPDEIVRLLTQAGFVGIGMFGDYDLKPWRQGAREWIICAERPLA